MNTLSVHNLVSIVIPAWNAERYIREAVDSALAQTYSAIEVIVVDDGSTDGTRALLESYAAAKRIVYIYQENKGLAGARNAGIRAAKGEYIALLDSDDVFSPGKVEKQVAVFEAHAEYGVCYSDIVHFTDTEPREFYHHRYVYPSGNILEPLLHRQFLNPLATVARKDVFERFGYFDETLRRSEDWDLWLRWAHAGVRFFYLDEPLAYYRMRLVGNLSDMASEPAMKEKNYELFMRFGTMLSSEEYDRYHFDDILRQLKTKVVFAELLVGHKERALAAAEHLPTSVCWCMRLIPSGVWKYLLTRLRMVKHRSLLRKLGTSYNTKQ